MLVSLTSVKLTWDQPEDNNAQIASYNIIYCTSDSDGSCVDQTPTTISVPTTEPMAVLDNLIPVRTYRVYIRAENDAGLGPQSQPYYFDSANGGMLLVSHSRILHYGSHSRVVWWHVCLKCWHLAWQCVTTVWGVCLCSSYAHATSQSSYHQYHLQAVQWCLEVLRRLFESCFKSVWLDNDY